METQTTQPKRPINPRLYMPRVLQEAADRVRADRLSARKKSEVLRFQKAVAAEVNARLQRAKEKIEAVRKLDDRMSMAISAAVQKVQDEMIEDFAAWAEAMNR